MLTLRKRNGGYLCGLVLFFVGVVAFVVGLATPNWSRFTFQISTGATSLVLPGNIGIQGHFGLWSICFKLPFLGTSCQEYPSTPAWMDTVKGLQCSALAVMFLTLCYAAAVNCFLENVKVQRFLEFGSGISGGLGLSGAVVYIVDGLDDFDSGYSNQQDLDVSISWSLGLSLGGSVCTILASFVIWIFNRPTGPQAHANTTEMVFTTFDRNAPTTAPASMAVQPPASGNPNTYMQAFPSPPPAGDYPNTYNMPAFSSSPPAYNTTMQGQYPSLAATVYTKAA